MATDADVALREVREKLADPDYRAISLPREKWAAVLDRFAALNKVAKVEHQGLQDRLARVTAESQGLMDRLARVSVEYEKALDDLEFQLTTVECERKKAEAERDAAQATVAAMTTERDALRAALETATTDAARLANFVADISVRLHVKADAFTAPEELLARIRAALTAKQDALRAALSRAAAKFREYETLHRAKHTPEGDTKADANMLEAAACEAALQSAPTPAAGTEAPHA